MARSMRLFLIRHGETVDNVAQLYAGSRDSTLTNHGYQQAIRLGQHFRSLGLTFTHLFSSHLQRAVKTAGKIREAQSKPASDGNTATAVPDIIQSPLLMEQDFGSMEGKKFYEILPEPNTSGKNKNTTDFVAVESKDMMAQRADSFLDEHLLPLLGDGLEDANPVVAIVSHGIFLSILWKRLLLRLPHKGVAQSPELQATARPSLVHLGGWSNTGYLELHMVKGKPGESNSMEKVPISETPAVEQNQGKGKVSPYVTKHSPAYGSDQEASAQAAVIASLSITPRISEEWTTTILTINGKDHLRGLKRTRGGIGSSRHDASQKSIENFFKRRKIQKSSTMPCGIYLQHHASRIRYPKM